MKLDFPLEIYMDDFARETYFKRTTFKKFVAMGGLSGKYGMSKVSEEATERLVEKGDIILIFNDNQEEIEWELPKEEELVALADKISAQDLVEIA